MKRSNLTRALVAVFPSALLLFAYATGPDPGYTAAPGDSPLACASAGCHTGTSLNGGGGNVRVDFPDGLTYTPGTPQTFSVVITDPQARVFGFQMTARLESDLANGQAGDFTATTQQYVICADASFRSASRACPGNASIEYIEHNFPYRTGAIAVSWTPPASNAGNVHIYVAANAANGDANNTGDHIYTANYVLSPQTSAPAPAIASVVSAGAFDAKAGLTSGAWLEMYGTGLSATTRLWTGSDFDGSRAPTSLDKVKVTVNGIPAYVDYVSPGQVNFQAPEDGTTGPVQIQLTNGGVNSNIVAMQKNALAPALLAPPGFNVDGRQFVVAQFPDQTFVGKPGLIAGGSFRPAKARDVITIYGVGFGAVTPATPAGVIASGNTQLQIQPQFRIGGIPATLTYAGLAPGAVGLYQFNVTVPDVTAGDLPLTVDVGGAALNQNLFVTVAQ